MRQVGILAAAGLYALEHHLPRLSEDHENAQVFAERVRQIANVSILPDPPPTNIIVIDIADTGKQVTDVLIKLREEGVLMVPFGPTRLRAIAHLDVTANDLKQAAEVLANILSE